MSKLKGSLRKSPKSVNFIKYRNRSYRLSFQTKWGDKRTKYYSRLETALSKYREFISEKCRNIKIYDKEKGKIIKCKTVKE